jgi:hypothetical protein
MKIGAVWHWYEFDSKHALELMNAHIKSIESQIARGIVHYKRNKKTELNIISEAEGIADEIEYYGGLESMSWNLNDLFKSHFPNLQRKSAFLTLYAFLEYELERLANKLRIESKLEVRPSDMSDQGVRRSLNYMHKVVRLEIDYGNAWGKVSSLSNLRNLIIHNDGRLTNHEGEMKSEAKAITQLKPNVTEQDDEVILGSKFLHYTLQRFDDLFKYLDKAIGQKYEAKRKRIATFKRTIKNRKKIKRKPAAKVRRRK